MSSPKINFIGTITKEPTLSEYVKNGVKHTALNLNVVVYTSVRKRDGEGYEPNWFDVSYSGSGISHLKNVLKAGNLINVNGEVALLSYTQKASNSEKSIMRVIAHSIDVLPTPNKKNAKKIVILPQADPEDNEDDTE